MNDEIAIRVNNLHKSFDLPENRITSLKQVFVNIGKKKGDKYRQKVLDGVEFEIKKGEFFGIVGRNGSGKSTLLKIIAGVYSPNKGNVEVNGSLTPFIELGVGFNPELTGRDNVYLSSSLLGYSRKQVDAMYEEIVAFAELEEHMDKKLKNYSSGMQVRLAFSIAIRAKGDILVLDEVLAVGDEAFQKKCMEVFREYKEQKRTVVLVTHSMDSVKSFCTRALLLSDGKVRVIGDVRKVANKYLLENTEAMIRKHRRSLKDNESNIEISGCKNAYNIGEKMNLKICWPKNEGVSKVGVAIINETGALVFGSNSDKLEPKENSIKHSLILNIGPGTYSLTVGSNGMDGGRIHLVEKAATFIVFGDNDDRVAGITRLEYTYSREISSRV